MLTMREKHERRSQPRTDQSVTLVRNGSVHFAAQIGMVASERLVCVCVCVCACERERERERVHVCEYGVCVSVRVFV